MLKASVIIPVKNGGALWRRVLERVLTQRTPWPYDVLVVDSGSGDGSWEYTQGQQTAHPILRLHRVPPQEFQHGRTRNLGVAMTEGEFAVLITQDALPADEHWLASLVACADEAPDIAGAFGRHLPYPGACPMQARGIVDIFDRLAQGPHMQRVADLERYLKDTYHRRFLHFFSDNNACLRRSVWQRFPYPEVDFGEDQGWADQILQAGYRKAYCDRARVYHSHNFTVLEMFRSSYDESRWMHHLFGYRLVRSFPRLPAIAARETWRDILWFFTTGQAWSQRYWLVRVPALNLARATGHYLGWRLRPHPLLTRRLSRTERLKRL